MKLFALGRTDLANSCKLWLAGKAEKFTEKVVILLRILSSVGDRVTPSGPPSALTSSTGGVVAGHRGCLQLFRRWDLFLLVDMAVFNGFRTDVVHCYLLSLSNRGFMLSLSTVFVRLSFSHNCLCHCVLVLVCNYPATHPQVLTPDGFSEDFFNHLKVRYNMKKGFPEYSQLRAEIISIVRWGLISPQRPQFES